MNISNHKAFTLIELLVVLAIIGIASAVIIPRISSDSQLFRAQVRELAAVLKYNRRMAIVSSQIQQAKLFPFQEGDNEDTQGKLKKGHWRSKGAELIWSNSLAQETKNQTISIDFFPQGGATGGEILLLQEQQKVKITIDGFTGKVIVEEMDE